MALRWRRSFRNHFMRYPQLDIWASYNNPDFGVANIYLHTPHLSSRPSAEQAASASMNVVIMSGLLRSSVYWYNPSVPHLAIHSTLGTRNFHPSHGSITTISTNTERKLFCSLHNRHHGPFFHRKHPNNRKRSLSSVG